MCLCLHFWWVCVHMCVVGKERCWCSLGDVKRLIVLDSAILAVWIGCQAKPDSSSSLFMKEGNVRFEHFQKCIIFHDVAKTQGVKSDYFFYYILQWRPDYICLLLECFFVTAYSWSSSEKKWKFFIMASPFSPSAPSLSGQCNIWGVCHHPSSGCGFWLRCCFTQPAIDWHYSFLGNIQWSTGPAHWFSNCSPSSWADNQFCTRVFLLHLYHSNLDFISWENLLDLSFLPFQQVHCLLHQPPASTQTACTRYKKRALFDRYK